MTQSGGTIQDIIVVGASTGGVEALCTLVAGLAPALPAAVFVVLHIGNNPSILPELLSQSGPLPAVHPFSGQLIVKGKIYVAPPDHHLLIEPNHMLLSRAAKENRARPGINPLFRSAAAAYGPRVTGVILTGGLDDGTAGLAEVKRRGGIAVVQDPRTALSPSMPRNAITHVDVDHILPLAEIPRLLSTLAITGHPAEERRKPLQEDSLEETFSGITCPECRGPIYEQRRGRIVEYRCRVGHAYSPLSLAQEHQEAIERTLWSMLVALEESADIADRIAAATPDGSFTQGAKKRREQIALIKKMLVD